MHRYIVAKVRGSCEPPLWIKGLVQISYQALAVEPSLLP